VTTHPTRHLLPLLAVAPLLLASCGEGEPGGAAALDPPHATVTDGATANAGPQWNLLSDEPDGTPLAAGAYGLTPNGVSHHVVVVRAPEGYQNLGGWTFVTGAPFHAMGFLTARRVPPNPCRARGRSKFAAAEDPGPSVEDLAEALVAQKGTETSDPVPVTIDGHSGLYLSYQVAKGIDVQKCEARAFDIFSTGPASWWLEASRERAAIWIVDVDGDRVVLAWVAVPGVPRAEMREMTRMVRSARFVQQ
jgi:hypothetical protein